MRKKSNEVLENELCKCIYMHKKKEKEGMNKQNIRS